MVSVMWRGWVPGWKRSSKVVVESVGVGPGPLGLSAGWFGGSAWAVGVLVCLSVAKRAAMMSKVRLVEKKTINIFRIRSLYDLL